jgi:hypothetical protein
MSTNRLNFFDPDFNSISASNYNLLLIASEDEFSFAVVQSDSKKLLVWGSRFALDELTDPKELQELLFAAYRNVIIDIQTKEFLLIPKTLYSTTSLKDISRYLNMQENDQLLTDELFENSIVAAFSVKAHLYRIINQRFPDIKLNFKPKWWIQTIVENLPHDYQLHLQVNENSLELLKFNDGKLQFYNQFQFLNADELVYFISFTLEQLNLSKDQIQLVLSGNINENDINYNSLRTFFPNIRWYDKPLLQVPSDVKFHEIITLSSLSLCE